MPSTPYAKLLVRLDAGTAQSGGVVATGGQVLTMELESTAGVSQQRWQIYAFPEGWTAPGGWTWNSSNNSYENLDPTPPAITLPLVATRWGKWMLRVTINEKPGVVGLVDESTAVETLSPHGFHDTAKFEGSQFGGEARQWLESLQKNARNSDAIAASVGGAFLSRFVYMPGCTPGGFFYDDLALAVAALQASQGGIRELVFDDSIDTVEINAVYDLGGNTIVRGSRLGLPTAVNFGSAGQLQGPTHILGCALTCDTSARASIVRSPGLPNAPYGLILDEQTSVAASSGTHPAIEYTSAGNPGGRVELRGGSSFSGSHPVLSSTDESLELVVGAGCSVAANMLVCSAAVTIEQDPNSLVSWTQTGCSGSLVPANVEIGSVLWRPDGTTLPTAPGVRTTWAQVKALLASIGRHVFVEVDISLGAAVIDAALAADQLWSLVGVGYPSPITGPVLVTVADGVLLVHPLELRGIDLVCTTTTGFSLIENTNIAEIHMVWDSTRISATDAAHAAMLLAHDSKLMLRNDSTFSGSHPVVHVNGHGLKIHLSENSSLPSDKLSGGSGTVDVYPANSAYTASATQTAFSGTLTVH